MHRSASAREIEDARSKPMFVGQVSELHKHVLKTYINYHSASGKAKWCITKIDFLLFFTLYLSTWSMHGQPCSTEGSVHAEFHSDPTPQQLIQ